MSHLLWNQWSNLWQLYSKVTFDGENRKIIVNPGENEISVKVDIYSAWKQWASTYDNMAFPEAIRVVGGDPIGGGLFTGDIYFLMNGWQIEVSEQVNFEGAIYHDDGIDVFHIGPGAGVTSTVSQLVQTVSTTGGTGDCPTTAQIAAAVDSILENRFDNITNDLSDKASQISVNNIQSDLTNLSTTVTALLNGIDSRIDIISDQIQIIDVDLNQMFVLLAELKKFNFNRSKIDPIDQTLTIYDDDNVTPIVIFDLLDTDEQPSVTEVAEKFPR